MKKITLLTLISFCCLAMGYAQPGELDPSFGTNGIVTTSLGVNYNYGGVAKKVLAQTDGSLYVITSQGQYPRETRNPGGTEISVIIKKHPDGSNDLS